MYDAFKSIKIRHVKFLAIVTSDMLNGRMKLGLYHGNERSKEDLVSDFDFIKNIQVLLVQSSTNVRKYL
jgi:hypothetical protein